MGFISTNVSLLPVYYLIFIYGFVYILPLEKYSWITLVLLYKTRGWDSRVHSMYSIFYFFNIGHLNFIKIRKKKSFNTFIWLILTILCFFMAGEISWGERLTNKLKFN